MFGGLFYRTELLVPKAPRAENAIFKTSLVGRHRGPKLTPGRECCYGRHPIAQVPLPRGLGKRSLLTNPDIITTTKYQPTTHPCAWRHALWQVNLSLFFSPVFLVAPGKHSSLLRQTEFKAFGM